MSHASAVQIRQLAQDARQDFTCQQVIASSVRPDTKAASCAIQPTACNAEVGSISMAAPTVKPAVCKDAKYVLNSIPQQNVLPATHNII